MALVDAAVATRRSDHLAVSVGSLGGRHAGPRGEDAALQCNALLAGAALIALGHSVSILAWEVGRWPGVGWWSSTGGVIRAVFSAACHVGSAGLCAGGFAVPALQQQPCIVDQITPHVCLHMELRQLLLGNKIRTMTRWMLCWLPLVSQLAGYVPGDRCRSAG